MIATGLLHLATTSGSAILGGVMRFMADSAKDRKERELRQHQFQMSTLKATDKSARSARKDAMKPISKTRRFVVIAVISAVLAMMFVGGLSDQVVNVPISNDGWTILGFTFGAGVEYEQLTGFLVIPEVLLAMNAIISMLFGSNIVKR